MIDTGKQKTANKRKERPSFFGGFTLIETMVAISLLVIAVAAPMSLVVQSLSSAFYARDQITAFYLAQEVVETVRAVRDGNALRAVQGETVDLLAGIPSTDGAPFIVDTLDNSMTACGSTCQVIQNNGTVYGYGNTGDWEDTRFRRTVTATKVGGSEDEIRVSVEVRWNTSVYQERSFTLSENLYRWVPDATAE